MTYYRIISCITILSVFMTGCVVEKSNQTNSELSSSKKIIASIENAATRTCINSEDIISGQSVCEYWRPQDELGVFTTLENNVRYTNDETIENVITGSFSPSETLSGDVTFVYYPYDENNNSNSPESLIGTIPTIQKLDLTTGAIPADYKYGEIVDKSDDGYSFGFHNLFSLARFKIDATGTELEGEELRYISLSVTRDGVKVPICGDFTFSAIDGSYSVGTSSSNTLTTQWTTLPILDSEISAFATVFPEIGIGDEMSFIVTTSNHQAYLTVKSKVDFNPEHYYNLPLTLSKFVGKGLTITQNKTFKCGTYNVKSSTNGTIGSMITEDKWDFFGLCEDFNKLSSNLTSYTFGKRGSMTASPRDGLGFATLNSSCSFSNEVIDEFDTAYGGLFGGANTLVDKGFRYYLVTFKDGTQIDVFITHMNTYDNSSTKYLETQHSQLKEIATYIAGHRNQRPVIFMGDTNCRYTRHDFETYFWSIIRGDNYTINDPWVDFMWDGVYPKFGTNSLVVEDAEDPSESDIICSNQEGEVVDKVIYVNDVLSDIQVWANGYLRDMSYGDLSDHKPIVIEFTYAKIR